MANNAFYDLQIFGSKESIDRLEKIMKYEDNEYFIYRVFSVERYDNEGGTTQFCGDVAWGFNEWFLHNSEHNKQYDGKIYTDLVTLSKVLDLTIEGYCEECGCCFMQYGSVSNGELLRFDETYWSDPGEIDDMEWFNSEVDSALKQGVFVDMEEVNEVRDDPKLLKDNYFSFGGYMVDFHTEEEILDKVAPTERKTIYRE